jgi:hypothetical protein
VKPGRDTPTRWAKRQVANLIEAHVSLGDLYCDGECNGVEECKPCDRRHEALLTIMDWLSDEVS